MSETDLRQSRLETARKTLRLILNLGGGFRGTLVKAWKILLEEGWPGISRRLAHVAHHSGARSLFGISESSYGANDYATWARLYDTLDERQIEQIRGQVGRLATHPLISILMPTYNTPVLWLQRAIDSVRNQIYPHWELCIADDASQSDDVRKILLDYAESDPRIRLDLRNDNGGIASSSNSALALARGEFVAFLDHDDELTPDALFLVAQEINSFPEVELIYSDEDKLDEEGRRTEPHFKPDWNYDLFLSYNLVSHLSVLRTRRVRELGGFRSGFDGAQDYDLTLRFVEGLKPDQIRHIPKVLYHWRKHEKSTASSPQAKPYAFDAAAKAIKEHLLRLGVAADVLEAPDAPAGTHRVRYDLPSVRPKVTLVIPTRNRAGLLRACIGSILTSTNYPDFDILVIDNGSDNPDALDYLQTLSSMDRIRVLRDNGPFNYSRLNNYAVREAAGEIVGLLNNDLEVIQADWLREMASHAARPEIGAVGARLRYPDGSLQHGGVIVGCGGVAGHAHKFLAPGLYGYTGRAVLLQNFSAVTAACLLVRKSVYEEAGGLDETLAVAFNDVDLCLRIGACGYRNLWTPYAELIHHESASRGLEDTPEKQSRFKEEITTIKKRWKTIIAADPAYNPNLALDREDFSLAWPPRTRQGPVGDVSGRTRLCSEG